MKDLVCTLCKKVYVSKMSEQVITLMQPGYCNQKKCRGQLEWRDSA